MGAGPTGLLLAGDLAASGVATTLLEKRSTESNLTRAFAVHARTLELLDARGLADELIQTGQTITQLRLFDQVQLDLSVLATRFPYVLITPQYQVERLLRRRAIEHGVQLVEGVTVHDLHQTSESVEIEASDDRRWRAAYVVGSDGVHSRVRRAVGLPFPGRSVLRSIMLGDVRLTEAPRDIIAVNAVGDAFAFVAPFGDGWYRIFAWNRWNQVADDVPLELDELREVTRRALGTDFGAHDPRWLSRFHSDERQVPQYRVGRVFLAGDAAHVHSPAGGQGMNTGLHDAANLSWKLSAAVHGWGAPNVLDTYHAERHPVGRSVLRSSGALVRLATIRSRWGRALRNFAGKTAMKCRFLAHRAVETISGLGITYTGGGVRAEDIALRGGVRLYEVLREQRFVLITPSSRDIDVSGWEDRVKVVTPAHPSEGVTLIRPDGYVAWRGDTLSPTTLTAWVGSPTS